MPHPTLRGGPPMDRWSRRQFVQGVGVAGLGLVAGCGRLPGQAAPAPARIPRIGWLEPTPVGRLEAFREGLRELGYIEGQNIIVEPRTAAGDDGRLAALAVQLARLPVDLVVADGSVAVVAVHSAAPGLPIVVTSAGD